MSRSTSSLLDKLPEPIRRDLKKSGILAALVLALVVLGVRQFGGSGPAKARAANVTSRTPTSVLPPVSAAKPEASNTKSEVSHRVAQWIGMPIKALDRNLFQSKLENFQRLDDGVSQSATVVAEDLFWDQLAKSLAAQADQKKQKQIRSENLQVAASSLRLQSTIMGSSPKALIDGRMVKAGDVVETKSATLPVSFRVSQIEARRIIIEREGVRIELKMGAGQARVLVE